MNWKVVYRAEGRMHIGHAQCESAREARDIIEESLQDVNSDVEIISIKTEGRNNARNISQVQVEESV